MKHANQKGTRENQQATMIWFTLNLRKSLFEFLGTLTLAD